MEDRQKLMKTLVTYKWKTPTSEWSWNYSYRIVDDVAEWLAKTAEYEEAYIIVNTETINKEKAEKIEEASPDGLHRGIS